MTPTHSKTGIRKAGFIGEIHRYNSSSINAWGGFYVFNPQRERRPRASENADCPFDDHDRIERSGGVKFRFEGRSYLFVENISPITYPFHGMVLTGEHRDATRLVDDDMRLCQQVVSAGLGAILGRVPEAYGTGPRIAVYCNLTKAAGASQPGHLHFCLVPFDGLPVFEAGDLPVNDIGDVFSKAAGDPFAWHGTRSPTTALRFIEAQAKTPCNLLVLPSLTGFSCDARFIMVPRRAETGAGFRPGGLEMMTGVLIARQDQLRLMSVEARDTVFSQTAIDPKLMVA